METKYIRYNVAWPPLPGIIGTTGSHQSVWNMSRRTTCLLAASRQIASQLATRLKRTTYDEDNMSPFDATLTSDNRSTIYIISITQQCSFQIKQPDTSTSDNTTGRVRSDYMVEISYCHKNRVITQPRKNNMYRYTYPFSRSNRMKHKHKWLNKIYPTLTSVL